MEGAFHELNVLEFITVFKKDFLGFLNLTKFLMTMDKVSLYRVSQKLLDTRILNKHTESIYDYLQ